MVRGDELTDPGPLSADHHFVGTPDDILAAIQASRQRLGYEELIFWARPPGLPVEQSRAARRWSSSPATCGRP